MTLADRIARAIELLESNGYRVAKRGQRGRPREIDRDAISRLIAERPDITNAEGGAIVGCSPAMFAKVRNGRR